MRLPEPQEGPRAVARRVEKQAAGPPNPTVPPGGRARTVDGSGACTDSEQMCPAKEAGQKERVAPLCGEF